LSDSPALDGMTALVTGASRGIGRAIAVGLAGAGADVIGVARSKDALDELGEEILQAGGNFSAMPADLGDADEIPSLADAAWAWRSKVDVLVNIAGIIKRTPTLEITTEEWDEIFRVNVKATFFMMQAMAARMMQGSGGSIINIASLAAQVVTGASVSYAASKAAVVQMSKVMAVRCAPKVRVNAVGPGYVRTALNEQWLDVPENSDYVLQRTPLGRVGTPDDVVGAVIFLASPVSSFVTGQHILIDGGWSTQ
jgi:NAD(P)-dependent dehydrogenase (short-subunit alcohol dehydrogenase family)